MLILNIQKELLILSLVSFSPFSVSYSCLTIKIIFGGSSFELLNPAALA